MKIGHGLYLFIFLIIPKYFSTYDRSVAIK